jgi:hypothetical protein
MDSYSHDAVDAPIVLDDEDGSDTEIEATSSSPDDDDRIFGATLPPDANDHDSNTSVSAVPANQPYYPLVI